MYLGKAVGDCVRAIKSVERELNKLIAFYDVKTVSLHGGPFVTSLTAASYYDILRVVKNIIPECDHVELSAESVDAIEVAEARWRAMLREKERVKLEII